MSSGLSKTTLTTSSSHSFTPSAPEFIPGRPYGSSSSSSSSSALAVAVAMLHENDDFTTGVGLSLNADEFIPGRLNNTSNTAVSSWSQSTAAAAAANSSSTDAVVDPSVVEKMVEVHWNGSTFYAPLSQTYVGEDGLNTYTGPVDEIYLDLGQQPGLQWTNGSYTLPAPPKRTLQTLGIAESMRSHFQSLDIEALRQMAPDDVRYKELPIRYHSAYPLDNDDRTLHTGNSFGYPSSLYKAIDQTDSQMYAVRRFDNVRTTQSVVSNTISMWQSIRHPSIVTLYAATIEKGALFFAYRYYPCAQSLKERFIDQRGPLLAESLIWRLLVQLLTAVRHVHNQGGSIRVIDPTHVILTSGTNARFSCVGILDVLEFESRKSISELQKDDLAKLGRLVLSLISRAVVTVKNSTEALAIAKQHYSIELQNAIITLVSYKCSIHQVCSMVSERILDELDASMSTADALHSHLHGEYENGRLLRLLLKLGAMNERPDHMNSISNSLAPQWSETGDRYVLKLFRDYVFHQCDPDGLPVLDAGHMITALNKLDVGDPEEVLLSSRDGKDLLVVSYLDVQRCLEKSFVDLTQQQAQRVPTIVDLPSQQHLPVVTNQSAAVAAASQLYQSASANNKVSDKAYIYPQEQSNSSMYPALPPPPPALPPRLNTAGLARSITTSTTHGPSSSSSSSSGLTTINPLNPVYNPSSTFSTGYGAFYNANNIYPGTSAAAASSSSSSGGDDAMIGLTHNGYIQPGSYGGATASYHHKADLKHLTTPIPTPAPAVAAPSSSKAAAALAWENSRLGAGNGMSRMTGGHYNAAASQRQHYAHYYPLPQVPPPPPQQQQQQQHQHQHQHHQQLPSPHGRIPQGSALPMGVAASSHDYGGQYNIEPTGRMGLHADLQLAPSQAVAPRGYYDGPGMMSSVGTSNTISSRGTGLPMNDTNRGMYGLGKQSHPTQYRHY